MTKIYEGGAIYTISLGCTGKTLELSEDEIKEIAEDYHDYNEDYHDYNEDLKDLEDENKAMRNSIEEQGQYIREIDDEIIPKLDECSNFIRKQSNQKMYNDVINQLQGVMSELDCLGKYI